MLNVEMVTVTDIGSVRKRNEDSLACQQYQHADISVCVVADGVGGHPGGDIASRLAVESVLEYVEQAVRKASNQGVYTEEWLTRTISHAILYANEQIRQQQQLQAEIATMATTIVVLLRRGHRVAVSHAGDSRCYRLCQGQLQQITEDHTLARQMLNDGTISQDAYTQSPYHHILNNGLGLCDKPQLSLYLDDCDNKIFLMCTDGLTDCVPDTYLEECLLVYNDLNQCADSMLQQALVAGGVDNISFALCRIKE